MAIKEKSRLKGFFTAFRMIKWGQVVEEVVLIDKGKGRNWSSQEKGIKKAALAAARKE